MDSSEEMNPYKASMLGILKKVGLEHYGTDKGSMPPRSDFEKETIASAMETVLEREKKHEENRKRKGIKVIRTKVTTTVEETVNAMNNGKDPCTIYLSFEESLEWKAFLYGLPEKDRFQATVRRRLCLSLWKAHCQKTCLFCWLPKQMCFCETLEQYRASLPLDTLQKTTAVTMLLHCEELMRSTNSGHVAAFLLGSPIRIWGLEEDDAYVRELQRTEYTPAAMVYNVSLYPEKGSPEITQFIEDTKRTHTEDDQSAKIHFILSDSTWGQALSLNRHIPREVTRVGITIEAQYESLFVHLRKRTRETGVSTLEATTMAVDQCMKAFGYTKEAQQLSNTLIESMKSFVDLKCLLKYTDAPFSQDNDSMDKLEERRDIYRRKLADERYQLVNERMQSDVEARKYLLPPVLNYCYCCDRTIGWHRMPEHVLGKGHRRALQLNPLCIPSEKSKSEVVYNFSRPTRAERKRENELNQQ